MACLGCDPAGHKRAGSGDTDPARNVIDESSDDSAQLQGEAAADERQPGRRASIPAAPLRLNVYTLQAIAVEEPDLRQAEARTPASSWCGTL